MSGKNRQRKRRKPPKKTALAETNSEPRDVFHVTASEVSFRGPIPPPEILEAYDRVISGSAGRIVAMAEKQSTHRMKLEEIVVGAGSRTQLLGMVFSFILSLAVLGVGVFLIYLDRNLAGFGLILFNLTTLAGVFVYGRHTQRKELVDSRKSFAK